MGGMAEWLAATVIIIIIIIITDLYSAFRSEDTEALGQSPDWDRKVVGSNPGVARSDGQ